MRLMEHDDFKEAYERYDENTAALIEYFIARIKSGADQRSYYKALIHFHEVCGCDILEATAGDFALYVRAIYDEVQEAKGQYSTCLKKRKILAAFIRYCLKLKDEGSALVREDFEDLLIHAPMKNLDDAFNPSRIPSVKELDVLIGYLKANDTEILLAVLFALRCYLHTGDIVQLRTNHLFYDQTGTCYLQTDKNFTVHVPEDFLKFLEEHVSTLEAGSFLFKSKKGGHLSAKWLSTRLLTDCKKAGLEPMTFTDIRNAAAVFAASNGADEVQISEAFGYKTNAHIARLTSLKVPVKSLDEYVNIKIK